MTVEERRARGQRAGFGTRWLPRINLTIVMAGLVPAIHGLFPSRGRPRRPRARRRYMSECDDWISSERCMS
jgi:hypothetical protein